MKVTKQQLIEQISQQTGLRRSEAKKAVEAVESAMDILSRTFAAGDNVYLRGFGTFAVRNAKEKQARIIATGETCIVPAHRTVKFKPSNELKNLLK